KAGKSPSSGGPPRPTVQLERARPSSTGVITATSVRMASAILRVRRLAPSSARAPSRSIRRLNSLRFAIFRLPPLSSSVFDFLNQIIQCFELLLRQAQVTAVFAYSSPGDLPVERPAGAEVQIR